MCATKFLNNLGDNRFIRGVAINFTIWLQPPAKVVFYPIQPGASIVLGNKPSLKTCNPFKLGQQRLDSNKSEQLWMAGLQTGSNKE